MLDKNLSVKEFLEYYGVVTEEECKANYGEPGADFKKGLEYLQKKRPPSGGGKADNNIYHSYVAILVMLRWLYIKPIKGTRRGFSMIPNNLKGNESPDKKSIPCENYTFGDTPNQSSAVFVRPVEERKRCYFKVLNGRNADDSVAQVIHQLWEFVREDKRQGFRSYVEEEFGIYLDGKRPLKE